jgi:hypothetical protein
MKTATKVTTMTHASGHTLKVFPHGPNHWYADWSNVDDLEWVGGRKGAAEFVARRKREGWTVAT